MAAGLDDQRDQQKFVEQLTETILWCRDAASLSEPETSLRRCKPQDLQSRHLQVSSVTIHRHWCLYSLSPPAERSPLSVTDLCGGRLLAYFPDWTMSHGVSQPESHGFLDVHDIPPYDTWVWLVQNIRSFFQYDDGTKDERDGDYLVAWVPPDFVPLADAGIKVNLESCILWLDTLDDEFVRSLRRLGFFQDELSSSPPS